MCDRVKNRATAASMSYAMADGSRGFPHSLFLAVVAHGNRLFLLRLMCAFVPGIPVAASHFVTVTWGGDDIRKSRPHPRYSATLSFVNGTWGLAKFEIFKGGFSPKSGLFLLRTWTFHTVRLFRPFAVPHRVQKTGRQLWTAEVRDDKIWIRQEIWTLSACFCLRIFYVLLNKEQLRTNGAPKNYPSCHLYAENLHTL